MTYQFERAGRKLFLIKNKPTSAPSTVMNGTDLQHFTDFRPLPAKVALINVDTAGKDVPLSGQEGI